VARRVLPSDLDARLVAAVVEQGGVISNYSALARACGLKDYRSAKKYCERLRGRIEEALAKAAAAATAPPAATPPTPLTREEHAVEIQRKVAENFDVIQGQIQMQWGGIHAYGVRLAEHLRELAQGRGPIKDLSPAEALRMLGGITRWAAKAAELHERIERARQPPTTVIGVFSDDAMMSVGDVIKEAEAMLANLKLNEAAYGKDGAAAAAAEPAAQSEGAPVAAPAAPPDYGAAVDWQPKIAAAAAPTCCGATMAVHGADPIPTTMTFICLRCQQRTRTQDGGKTYFAVPVGWTLPAATA
jgi:hypothetical protein